MKKLIFGLIFFVTISLSFTNVPESKPVHQTFDVNSEGEYTWTGSDFIIALGNSETLSVLSNWTVSSNTQCSGSVKVCKVAWSWLNLTSEVPSKAAIMNSVAAHYNNSTHTFSSYSWNETIDGYTVYISLYTKN